MLQYARIAVTFFVSDCFYVLFFHQDVTTVEEIVTKIESQYGAADRIWVMDRGMISADNIDSLKSGKRRFIIGTPKSALKKT